MDGQWTQQGAGGHGGWQPGQQQAYAGPAAHVQQPARRRGVLTLVSRGSLEPLHMLFGGPGALAALGVVGYVVTQALPGGIQWELHRSEMLIALAIAAVALLFADLGPAFTRIDTRAGTISSWRSVVLFRWLRKKRSLDEFVRIATQTQIVHGSHHGRRTTTIWRDVHLVHRDETPERPGHRRLTIMRTTMRGKAEEAALLAHRLTGLPLDVAVPPDANVTSSRFLRRGLLGILMLLGTFWVAFSLALAFVAPRIAYFAMIPVPRYVFLAGAFLPVLMLVLLVRGAMLVRDGIGLPGWALDPPRTGVRPAAGCALALAALGALFVVGGAIPRLLRSHDGRSSDPSASSPGTFAGGPATPTWPPSVAPPSSPTFGPSAQPPGAAPSAPADSRATTMPPEAGLTLLDTFYSCDSGTHHVQNVRLTGSGSMPFFMVSGSCVLEIVSSEVTTAATQNLISAHGHSQVTLTDCTLSSPSGVASEAPVNIGDQAQVTVVRSRITGGNEAVSLNDRGSVTVQDSQLAGVHAVTLMTRRSSLRARGSTFTGGVDMFQSRTTITDDGGNTGLPAPPPATP